MGCNGNRADSSNLQPVSGSVCTTNMQSLCQILLSQTQEAHAHVPSKASELSAEDKTVWEVPLPAETPVTNLAVSTVLLGCSRQKKGEDGDGNGWMSWAWKRHLSSLWALQVTRGLQGWTWAFTMSSWGLLRPGEMCGGTAQPQLTPSTALFSSK